MAISEEDILKIVNEVPGLTDREITNRLFGEDAAQQRVNLICRRLAKSAKISRCGREDGLIGNFPFDAEKLQNCSKRVRSAKACAFEPCPPVPDDLLAKALEMGAIWAASTLRPRISTEILRHWDALIEEWAAASHLPILLRKQSRGNDPELRHTSKRTIVLTDNSPAQWAFHSAWNGLRPTLLDIAVMLQQGTIPFSFIQLNRFGIDLNNAGWKLCHIEPIGLRTSKPMNLPIEKLERTFSSFLKPSNHFLVPKQWAGFGEIPEVIKALSEFDQQR